MRLLTSRDADLEFGTDIADGDGSSLQADT